MSYIVRSFAKDWESIKYYGRLRFIFLYGVIAWGMATAALSTAIFACFAPQLSAREFAILAFSVFPVFGILFAWETWNRVEAYHQEIESRNAIN
jgi:hypothetical protein